MFTDDPQAGNESLSEETAVVLVLNVKGQGKYN
jgi:hypothetical protein